MPKKVSVDEWKHAARGGYKYSGSDNLDDVGWYRGNSGDKTHPVAQKKPNGYGLYDMSGNVWEWCWDAYGSSRRYIRGGGYDRYDYGCRVANGSDGSACGQGSYVEFRIVCSSGK